MPHTSLMLEVLFGNKSAVRVLLYLSRRSEAYATEISKNLGIPLNMVQKQLERLEDGGIFKSDYRGKLRIYRWNPDFPFFEDLQKILNKEIAFRDPADGTYLSLQERLALGDKLSREAAFLNPIPRPRPFAKSFRSFSGYERWRRQQKNPWLF